MPRKSPDLDLDFNIFVDPSCLSAPMDEETPMTQTTDNQSPAVPPAVSPAVSKTEAEEENDIKWKDIHLGPSRAASRPQSAMDASTVEDAISELLDEMDVGHDRVQEHEHPEHEDDSVNAKTDCGTNVADTSFNSDDETEGQAAHETRDDDDNDHLHVADDTQIHEDETDIGDEQSEQAAEEKRHDPGDEDIDHASSEHDVSLSHDDKTQRGQPYEDGEVDQRNADCDEISVQEETSILEERSVLAEPSFKADEPSFVDEDAQETETLHDDSLLESRDEKPTSRRTSTHSDRRASLRTEALIQAAARAVVAQIEERAIAAVNSSRTSLELPDDADHSLLSTTSHDEPIPEQEATSSPSRRQSSNSSGSQLHHTPSGDDAAGDSSSHHEAEDDVFSDRSSARSSLGSFEDTAPSHKDETLKTPVRNNSAHSRSHSPRLSCVSSIISGLSQYDEDDYIPTTTRRRRDTPRMPFRTPSDVRAIQMSSPTPSVFNGASPRSTRRNNGGGLGSSSGLPTVSRLGSPAQYSPKNRSTPPRFKMRKEAPPLVLLHVTLLPLRWPWGDVLDGLDAEKDSFRPSDELDSLRDAWRQLQDRVGDTVLERGVLLPHPQNDYEVLEERLLEALELPLRRRARILECGHYLGPANEMGDEESSESEDEYASQAGRLRQRGDRRHWCATCKGEIKYEDLGPGKVFRVKVYASNGLMKAGAWAACWKEMERVDVEVEPIVDTALQRELERLSAFHAEQDERRQRELEEDERARREEELRAEEEIHLPRAIPSVETPYDDHHQVHSSILSSPPHQAMHASPLHPSSPMLPARSPSPLLQEPIDTSEARRRRDEARLREIYGLSPPPVAHFDHNEDDVPHPESQSSFLPPDPEPAPRPNIPSSYATPRSPSEEAHERRTQRRTGQAYQTASLPELLLEAVKVLLRDRKNVAIAVLGLFVVLLALRPNEGRPDVGSFRVAVPVRGELGLEEGYRFETVVAGGVTGGSGVDAGGAVSGTVIEVRTEDTETLFVEAATAKVVLEQERATVGGAQPGAETAAAEADTESSTAVDNGVLSSALPEETIAERKVVRVVETVTETVKISVTATESVAAPRETKTEVNWEEEAPTAKFAVLSMSDLHVCPLETRDVCLSHRGLTGPDFESGFGHI